MTEATDFFDLNAAPMRVGTVRLKVRDLQTVAARAERDGVMITGDATGITLRDPWSTAVALTH